MATATLTIAYRPIKVGFLVRDGSIEDLKSAVELCTVLLGGIYNPIIPVRNDRLTERLIRLFRCDVLFPVIDDEHLQEIFNKYPELAWPTSLGKPHLLNDYYGEPSPSIQDITQLISYYWEKAFRHKDSKGNCFLPLWKPDDPLANIFTVMFGKYPNDLKRDYENDFITGLKAETIEIKDDSLSNELINLLAPIRITKDKLTTLDFPYESDGVYFGQPDSFDDLINFWNIRAMGSELTFWPINQGERLREFIQSYLIDLYNRSRESSKIPSGVVVRFNKSIIDFEKIKSLAPDIIPAEVPAIFDSIDNKTWEIAVLRPQFFNYESQNILVNIDILQDNQPDLTFQVPSPPYPDKRFREGRSQLWAIDVNPLTEFGYDGHTLRPPDIPQMNDWCGRKCILNAHSLRIGMKGITVLKEHWNNSIYLRPMNVRKLIQQTLSVIGISANLSMAGTITDRIIAQMGGLEKCRVFKIRGVRKLINNPGVRKGITRSQATLTIYDQEDNGSSYFEENFKRLRIQKSNKPFLSKDDVLDFLLEKNIFRPGLELSCPNCLLDYWSSIDDLKHEIVCELCGHHYKIGPLLGNRADWKFRLTGLFGRGDNQEGAIPVILTLLQLYCRHNHSSTFIYSTNLELKTDDGAHCETDLLVIELDSEAKPVILIGECKTNNEIEDEDIRKLSNIRTILNNTGIQCCLIFSKTAPSFTGNEISRFQKLHGEGVPFILFTAQELEPYEPYNRVRDKELRFPYASSLLEMAHNSVDLYLKK